MHTRLAGFLLHATCTPPTCTPRAPSSVTVVCELILNRAGCVLSGLFPPYARPLVMFGTVLAALVGARLAWWAWYSPTPEQYTFHEDESWRSYAQREEALRTAAAQQRLRAQEAARLEQERWRRAAASTSAARFTARDDAQAPLRPAPYPGETRPAAPRAPCTREPSPFRARRPDHAYSDIDTGTDSDVSDTPTDAVSIISHAHGRERRAQRGVERRQLQAAVKHGQKTPGRPGRDGKQRWRFEYNGVVYITDETCRHEITTWRV